MAGGVIARWRGGLVYSLLGGESGPFRGKQKATGVSTPAAEADADQQILSGVPTQRFPEQTQQPE